MSFKGQRVKFMRRRAENRVTETFAVEYFHMNNYNITRESE